MISTELSEKDIYIKYGLYNLCPEREMARASLKYIYGDMHDIKKSYFKLGFHLHEFKKYKYYEDFGYISFEEFCENNFDMDKSAISRCINVFLMTTSKDEVVYTFGCKKCGCESVMSEKYSAYSYSQLCEMLPLNDIQRSLVKPEMTVRQIRELKNRMDITPEQILLFVEYFKKNLDPCTYSQVQYKMCRMADGNGTAYHDENVSFSCSHGLYYVFGSKGYKTDKLLDYYIKCGGSFTEDAMSQLEDDDTPLYSGEDFEKEDFLDIMFSKFREVLEYLSVDVYDFSRSGKQLSFKDLDKNEYKILFRVMKKR